MPNGTGFYLGIRGLLETSNPSKTNGLFREKLRLFAEKQMSQEVSIQISPGIKRD